MLQPKKKEEDGEKEKERKEEEKEGGLAKLFGALGENAGKMQVIMEKKHEQDDSLPEDQQERDDKYMRERSKRKLYQSPDLQSLAVTLVISLLIRPNGTLEEKYTAQFPLQVLFLFYHFTPTSIPLMPLTSPFLPRKTNSISPLSSTNTLTTPLMLTLLTN